MTYSIEYNSFICSQNKDTPQLEDVTFHLTLNAPIGTPTLNDYRKEYSLTIDVMWLYIEEAWWTTYQAAKKILTCLRDEPVPDEAKIADMILLVAYLRKTDSVDVLHEHLQSLRRAKEEIQLATARFETVYYNTIEHVRYMIEPQLNELSELKGQ